MHKSRYNFLLLLKDRNFLYFCETYSQIGQQFGGNNLFFLFHTKFVSPPLLHSTTEQTASIEPGQLVPFHLLSPASCEPSHLESVLQTLDISTMYHGQVTMFGHLLPSEWRSRGRQGLYQYCNPNQTWIYIDHPDSRQIKMSSPNLNNVIIIGCILCYSRWSVLPLYSDHQNYSSVIILGLDSSITSVDAFPYICTAKAWILMAGFTLSFGSMFSKTWRVHSIFTNVQLNKKVCHIWRT